MTGVDSIAFEGDLRRALQEISSEDPHYLVPVPRKAVKLLKLNRDLLGPFSDKLYYTSAFYWSPSLSRLTGKRIALLDDAVVRGKTLARHRDRFASRGAEVQTYALYQCTDLSRVQVESIYLRSQRPHVVRAISPEDYLDYNNFVQTSLRAINPLLEHDHLRVQVTDVALDERGFDFIDLVTVMGGSVAYPYNLAGPILGVTIINPTGTDELLSLADAAGISRVHSKIRAFFDLENKALSFVPMAFPDISFATGAVTQGAVWTVLNRICKRIGCQRLPEWESGQSLRNPERLVYELICYSLSSYLLSATLSNSPIRSRREKEDWSLQPDTSDHRLRFGPELSGLVDQVSSDGKTAQIVLGELASSFISPPQLDLGDFEQRGSAPLSEEIAAAPKSLYAVCTQIVSSLKKKFEESADSSSDSQDLDDRQGWTYSEICSMWPDVPRHFISEAIDFLCDNGFIVPWFSTIEGDIHVFGRKYRTGENTSLKATFDAVIDFVAFVTRVARDEVKEMRDGVELTFLNKLIANILLDLESFLSPQEAIKLEAISAQPGLFGPEAKIRHLLTGYREIGLIDLTRYAFELRPKVMQERATRGLIEPNGSGFQLSSFDPPTAALIEELTKIYVLAYNRLGKTVREVLLPLALYRHREDAYAYMYKDLILWLEAFEASSRSWGMKSRTFTRAHDALDSFKTKYELARDFRQLWKRFLDQVQKKSVVLSQRLALAVDSSACETTNFRALKVTYDLFAAIQTEAEHFSRSPQEDLPTELLVQIEKALKAIGVGAEPLLISDRRPELAAWLERTLTISVEQLHALPEPSQHVSVLRETRLRDQDITNRAIRRIQSRGKLPVYVMMGDLFHSKVLTNAAEAIGVDYVTRIAAPYQQMVTRLATAYHAEYFNLPHGDDFQLLFGSLEEALSFSARLYQQLEGFEAELRTSVPGIDPSVVSEGEIRVLPKIGLVAVETFDRALIQQRIHLCSMLISSGAPVMNSGDLLIRMDVSLPETVSHLAKSHCALPQGVVMRFEHGALASIFGKE